MRLRIFIQSGAWRESYVDDSGTKSWLLGHSAKHLLWQLELGRARSIETWLGGSSLATGGQKRPTYHQDDTGNGQWSHDLVTEDDA